MTTQQQNEFNYVKLTVICFFHWCIAGKKEKKGASGSGSSISPTYKMVLVHDNVIWAKSLIFFFWWYQGRLSFGQEAYRVKSNKCSLLLLWIPLGEVKTSVDGFIIFSKWSKMTCTLVSHHLTEQLLRRKCPRNLTSASTSHIKLVPQTITGLYA